MGISYDRQAVLDNIYAAVDEDCQNLQPSKITHINAYEITRVYGGPEEGGWWYDQLTPISSIRVYTLIDALSAFGLLEDILESRYDDGIDISSVLSKANLGIYAETEPAVPSEPLTYE